MLNKSQRREALIKGGQRLLRNFKGAHKAHELKKAARKLLAFTLLQERLREKIYATEGLSEGKKASGGGGKDGTGLRGEVIMGVGSSVD